MLLPDPAIASTPEPAASETAPGWIGSWASNKGAATVETPAPAPPPGDAPPPHTAPLPELRWELEWHGAGPGGRMRVRPEWGGDSACVFQSREPRPPTNVFI